MAQGKRQFQNTTDGFVGVLVYTPRGDEKAIALAPGETVFLSEEEIELTRDAPGSARDNPFREQSFLRRDPQTEEVIAQGTRAPLEEVHEVRETPEPTTTGRRVRARQTEGEVGATHVAKSKLAPAGSFAQGEEVGS